MHIMELAVHPALYSLNISFADRLRTELAARDHVICYSDLYRESFDPVLGEEEIRRGFSFDEKVLFFQKELQNSGGLALIHPDWWGQPPALLKGWLDRVLSPGVAYRFEGQDFEEKKKIGLLTGKKVLVVITSDNPQNTDYWTALWRDHVFGFCGVSDVKVLFLDGLRDREQGELSSLIETNISISADYFNHSG